MGRHVNKIVNSGLLLVFMVAIGITLYAAAVSPADKQIKETETIPFSENWYYTDSEGQKQQVTLSEKTASAVNENIVLFKTLPQTLPEDAILCLKLDHNRVRAFLDGKETEVAGIYENRTFNTRSVALWGTISLQPEDAGKTIKIELCENRGMDVINIDAAQIMNRNVWTHQKLKEESIFIVLFSMMLVLAIILWVISLIFGYKKLELKYGALGYRYLALFIFCAAIWLLADSNILELIFGYTDGLYFMSFYSFFLLPIPFTLFMGEVLERRRRIFQGIALLFMVFFLSSVALVWSGQMTSLATLLFIPHSLIALLGVMMLYFGVTEYIEKRERDIWEILLGILAITALALPAFWMFYKNSSDYSNFFALGVFCFVFFLSLGLIARAVLVIKKAADSKKNQTKALQAQNSLRVSQISTHFFYHVMSTSRTLVKTDPDTAYKMLGDISKYLRYKTDSNEMVGSLVKFRDEMKAIKAYVDMKKVLLGDRLTVRYTIDVEDFYIPVLTIQPLVENAIKHGIEKKEKGGTILITTAEEADYYVVTIEDDGAGFDTAHKGDSGKLSVSHNNIRERLAYYGKNEINIDTLPGQGTRVVVRIVKGLEPEEADENS